MLCDVTDTNPLPCKNCRYMAEMRSSWKGHKSLLLQVSKVRWRLTLKILCPDLWTFRLLLYTVINWFVNSVLIDRSTHFEITLLTYFFTYCCKSKLGRQLTLEWRLHFCVSSSSRLRRFLFLHGYNSLTFELFNYTCLSLILTRCTWFMD